MALFAVWRLAIIQPMDRRRCLKHMLQGAACFCVPPRWEGARTAGHATPYYPSYIDVAEKAGLTAKTIISGDKTKDFLLSTTGGGVALFDYDNDGWLDIFIANGWGLGQFPEGQEPFSHLYRNNRDGTFKDVTQEAGLVRHGWTQGVCVGDFNNDGNLDLFVTYYGKNVLFRNNGDGTFTDITKEAGLLQVEDRYNTGAAFLDYDRDGHLDLFVANYVGYKEATVLYDTDPSIATMRSPVRYGVEGLPGSYNILYHNNGNGTFTDVSQAAGILKPAPTYGFTPCVADFDNDGWPDIYVAADAKPSLLFHNNRDGTFSEIGLMAGVALDINGRPQAGMGVATGDYDENGFLDIIKTNFSDDTPSLYRNEGNAFFTDVTNMSGLAGLTKSVKWGTGFFDFDNDGWPDIFIAGGPIYPPRGAFPPEAGSRILLRNLGDGRFQDISQHCGPGISAPRCSRGAAVGDIFNTGQIDLVINNINDCPLLLRNQSPSPSSWLLVRLIGSKTNRAAIGSRVVVEAHRRRQFQEVQSGGSFCSQNDLRLHFGLGTAGDANVEVQWLGGAKENFERIPANRLVTIQEGKGILSQDTF